MQQKWAFIHIQKTAGTTLRKLILEREGAAACAEIYREETLHHDVVEALANPAIAWLTGHFPLYQELKDPAIKRTTLLRDPQDRVLSHYFHVLRSTKAKHLEWKREFSSLPEFLAMPRMQNVETRFLAGLDEDAPPPTEAHLNAALENLQSFSFVGIQEFMRPSLILLADTLGWKNLVYETYNRGGEDGQYARLKKEFEADLKAATALDQRLYNHARLEFTKRWNAHPNKAMKLTRLMVNNQLNALKARFSKTGP